MVGQKKKIEIVKHFQMENIPRSRIYSIIKRCENGLPIEDKSRTGRPAKMHHEQQKKLKKCAENRVGVSQRKLAMKFSVSQSCVRRNIEKVGLRYHKRQQAPKYSPKQLEQMSNKCRKLHREIFDQKTTIIIDDEKYFSFWNDNMPKHAVYYCKNKEKVIPDVKFRFKQKFTPKILVWLALSTKGISQPYIRTTKGEATNAKK